MSPAQWNPQAELDVEEIYWWIAIRDRRSLTAKKILREIRQVCDEYAEAFVAGSVLGTARPDWGESYRAFTHKRWVIVFRPIDDGIEIIRVVDGSRDFSRIFGD
jgi:toxin ParE1/3/4